MHLPDRLLNLDYVEWNATVRGIVVVWEWARVMGAEAGIEARLLADDGGDYALALGALGRRHFERVEFDRVVMGPEIVRRCHDLGIKAECEPAAVVQASRVPVAV